MGLLPKINYFKGFEWTKELDHLFKCLEIIEKWKELAIRPASQECPSHFLDLWSNDCDDDVAELQRRCLIARKQLNESLLQIETTIWDKHLIPRTSGITNAGLGLFYLPSPLSPSKSKQQDDYQRHNGQQLNCIPKGTTICFYTEYIHTFQSAKELPDQTYLMSVLGHTLVDPRPRRDIKARYINDPLNEELVNCNYIPEEYRSAVVVTRDILPGEELFASYGDIYWSQQQHSGIQVQISTNNSYTEIKK
mmetsp:Transcript_35962/g.36408  ORF Transcript_35962/g.36408 Transcript_35962/m.36408 type:complete len:250 (+) Transcript_35962:504-1253(+)